MTESRSRLPADNPTVLLGVVTIVSGVATGLIADLPRSEDLRAVLPAP